MGKWLAAAIVTWVLGIGAMVGVGFLWMSMSWSRELTADWACEPGEEIVEERQIGHGVAPNKTRMCCADARDEREFGRCDWSSSMDAQDAKVYVPAIMAGGAVGLVFGRSELCCSWWRSASGERLDDGRWRREEASWHEGCPRTRPRAPRPDDRAD